MSKIIDDMKASGRVIPDPTVWTPKSRILDVPKLSEVERDLFIRYCAHDDTSNQARDIRTLLFRIQELRQENEALRLVNKLPPFDEKIPLPAAQDAIRILSNGRYRLEAVA